MLPSYIDLFSDSNGISKNTVHLNFWFKLLVINISKEMLHDIEFDNILHFFNNEPSYVIGLEVSVIV